MIWCDGTWADRSIGALLTANTVDVDQFEINAECLIVDFFTVGQDYCPFNGVLQLSDISRPLVGCNSLDGSRRQAHKAFPGTSCLGFQHTFGQIQDVFAPFSQGW